MFGNVASGLIGIVGVVVGIILDRTLRSWGRTILHFPDWQVRYSGHIAPGETGATAETASAARFNFDVEAYNTRDEPAALRMAHVAFQKGDKLLLTVPIRRMEDEGLIHPMLNLAPKLLLFEGTLRRADLDAVAGWTAIYFVTEDEKGKKHRWLIEDQQKRPAEATTPD